VVVQLPARLRVRLARLGAAAFAALLIAPAAHGGTGTNTVTNFVYDGSGHLIQTPFSPAPPKKNLTSARALAIFLHDGKVSDWLDRYPEKGRYSKAGWYTETSYKKGAWEIGIWWGKAGEVAKGKVDDVSGRVTEAFTGPQVAWGMARGGPGAFGGDKLNSPVVWLGFCAIFLLGLAELRRPFSLRNLDLIALLAFTPSLWYFNRGDIFTSAPLAYPPMVYLILRALWIGFRGRTPASRPVWPAWVLVGATVFLVGFRIGLNVQTSNVIDVGFSGVIGADRIVHGQSPYGHMPIEDNLKACGPANAEGETRERIQTNGRCESANERGDTYGPVSYEAYIPAFAVAGWSGKWDKLPTARYTSLLFDVLCVVGLALLGARLGGGRLAATLAFSWAAYPFTQYVSNSNTNDAIVPAFLIFGLWLASHQSLRGGFAALSGWTKFGALLVLPLWLSYPKLTRAGVIRFLVGFAVATMLAFSIVLLEPDPLHALRLFWDRTLGWQLGRESPFSVWDWRQYHAKGLPDLHRLQQVIEAVVVLGSIALAFVPRRKSLLQLTALTGAVVLGFELVLTHWFYLYIPWFFPFVAAAAITPSREVAAEATQPSGREIPEPVPAG
jgi:hypothetical protein